MTRDDEKKPRKKRGATGGGYVYEAFNAFHIRYYKTEIDDDGTVRRYQKSEKLCAKDAAHPNVTCKAVRDLRQQFMVTVNAQKPNSKDMPIGAFWPLYLNHCNEVRKDGQPRKKPSTVGCYTQIYEKHLKKHFGDLKLSEYEPKLGSALLDSLTAKLGINALKHLKVVGMSIFERAKKEERISVNPWREVVIPEDAMPSVTVAYTEEEAAAIFAALKDRVDAQLAFALACYGGLRPGEIVGLKWEDVDGDWLHIRTSVVRGVIGTPKTQSSIAPVGISVQVRALLEAWWEQSGRKTEGWVFPNSRGGAMPVSPNNLAARVVVPALKKARLKWRGWYAGRRSCATWIIENTGGNAAVAQAQLRHKHMSTTTNVYKKAITLKGHIDGIRQAFMLKN